MIVYSDIYKVDLNEDNLDPGNSSGKKAALYVELGFDILLFVYWWILIFSGTKFEVFFSKCKILSFMFIASVVSLKYVIRINKLRLLREASDYTIEFDFMFFYNIFGLFNHLYIMISLIYTGMFHKSFSIKGNDEQKQKEKHIARVTMVVKD